MVGSSQPVAGVGIGDRHGETAATDRDQEDVEHQALPFTKFKLSKNRSTRISQVDIVGAEPFCNERLRR
jgi:hypothetical protein